jgi:hypothetical protein
MTLISVSKIRDVTLTSSTYQTIHRPVVEMTHHRAYIIQPCSLTRLAYSSSREACKACCNSSSFIWVNFMDQISFYNYFTLNKLSLCLVFFWSVLSISQWSQTRSRSTIYDLLHKRHVHLPINPNTPILCSTLPENGKKSIKIAEIPTYLTRAKSTG